MLFNIFTIHQAEIESTTQINDHIIHVFAFLVFSSSHQEIRYIIQLIIRAITATTATICIASQIILVIKSIHISLEVETVQGFVNEVSLFPGNQNQFISGVQANT